MVIILTSATGNKIVTTYLKKSKNSINGSDKSLKKFVFAVSNGCKEMLSICD